MRKRIEKIILKHYGKQSHLNTRGWEQCGNEIRTLVQSEQDKALSRKNLCYSEECDLKDKIRNNIEGIYESYFKVGSMYSWIHGNENLKQLVAEQK